MNVDLMETLIGVILKKGGVRKLSIQLFIKNFSI